MSTDTHIVLGYYTFHNKMHAPDVSAACIYPRFRTQSCSSDYGMFAHNVGQYVPLCFGFLSSPLSVPAEGLETKIGPASSHW